MQLFAAFLLFMRWCFDAVQFVGGTVQDWSCCVELCGGAICRHCFWDLFVLFFVVILPSGALFSGPFWLWYPVVTFGFLCIVCAVVQQAQHYKRISSFLYMLIDIAPELIWCHYGSELYCCSSGDML